MCDFCYIGKIIEKYQFKNIFNYELGETTVAGTCMQLVRYCFHLTNTHFHKVLMILLKFRIILSHSSDSAVMKIVEQMLL